MESIDVEVYFANEQSKKFEIPADSLVSDVVVTIANEIGLTPASTCRLIEDWGLAVYNGKGEWINLQWLEPTCIVSQAPCDGKLLFAKKTFFMENEFNLLLQSPFLRQILYYQLLQFYLSGFVYCVAFRAAKLSALAAFVQVTNSDYLTSGTEWLKAFIPPRLKHIPWMLKVISKNMDNIGHRSSSVVQTAFIKGLISLETFGYCLYSGKIEDVDGIFGIRKQDMVWMDRHTMEPIMKWNFSDLLQFYGTKDNQLVLRFHSEQVLLHPHQADQVSKRLADFFTVQRPFPAEPCDAYILNTGEDEPLEGEGSSVVDVSVGQQLELRELREEERRTHRQLEETQSMSPISRNGERRKAFRQKSRVRDDPRSVNNLDTVEELSTLMDTDFSRETKWTLERNSPIYDSVASTRLDATLQRSKVTFSSLSQTLKLGSSMANHVPPPLPAKPTDMVTQQEEVDSPDYSQRLGAYALEASHSVSGIQSRIVLPGEILKDYATVRREFRMFCVKLPNGQIHWELASLFQPIKKLIARLCVLIHIEDSDQYRLVVEGSVLTHLREMNVPSSDIPDGPQSPSSREFTPSPGAKRRIAITAKELLSPQQQRYLPFSGKGQDQPLVLDSQQTFCDQGITTSRLLSLLSNPAKSSPGTLNVTPIRVPGWVKFRQCWLSIVQGNQPCSLREAITLAAILYQCYVLDRGEANSVISFCNVTDFLPPEYASVRGIENRILQEREDLLCYTRSELEQFYIEGVSSSPLSNYAFFPCKEPRRQFLANSKMCPVLLGIGREGVVRVDFRTKQIIDTWGYETLKNWGFARKSFMLAFESSTYPVKCSEGKWMAELVSFNVQSIVKMKGIGLQESATPSPAPQQNKSHVHRYFSLEVKDQEDDSVSSDSEEPPPNGAVRESKYFILEKVYDDLLTTQKNDHESLYVNPEPNRSLLNPDAQMVARFKKLGIMKDDEHFYDQVASIEEVLYDEVPDDNDLSEDATFDDKSCDSNPLSDPLSEGEYDDIMYYRNGVDFRHSHSRTRPIVEHVYDIPPDCV